MKNILFAIIITFLSCVPLTQAQQPYLTKDGLLSYQDASWHYTGGLSTEMVGPNEHTLKFEAEGWTNPIYLILKKDERQEIITQTIINTLKETKQTDHYKKGSTEFKELNKIFELFGIYDYQPLMKKPDCQQPYLKEGKTVVFDTISWKIIYARPLMDGRLVIHLKKSKHMKFNIYEYMKLEKYYDEKGTIYIAQETGTAYKTDPKERNITKRIYYSNNPRFKELEKLYETVFETQKIQFENAQKKYTDK